MATTIIITIVRTERNRPRNLGVVRNIIELVYSDQGTRTCAVQSLYVSGVPLDQRCAPLL